MSAGGGAAMDSPSAAAAVVMLHGKVHGGVQPISGAQILLYSAGTAGAGTATSLLTTNVQTGTYGDFAITGDYACPSPDSQVYLLAKGGDTGGGINAKSLLISALGRCGDLSNSTFVSISEVSTVATVYALQQFMTPGTMDISSSAGGTVGLANAFRMANNLMDTTTGQARATTVAGNGIVPQSTINALANIMAACVNTRGTDVVCQSLFSKATPTGGIAPAETLTAMLDVALNPGTTNGTALYNLQPAVAPFQPTLTSVPSDWTLSVEYSGGGLSYPEMPAVDAQGNIWVPNAVSPGTLTELSPTGAILSPDQGFSGGGLNNPFASAVDLAGNVWSANFGNSSVSAHASTGAALSPASGYVATGMVQPNAIAVDVLGQVFTTNQNNSVTKLSNAGVGLATIQNGGLNGGFAVAVDASQNIWVANSNGSSVSKVLEYGHGCDNGRVLGRWPERPVVGCARCRRRCVARECEFADGERVQQLGRGGECGVQHPRCREFAGHRWQQHGLDDER